MKNLITVTLISSSIGLLFGWLSHMEFTRYANTVERLKTEKAFVDSVGCAYIFNPESNSFIISSCEIMQTIDSIRNASPCENTDEMIARVLEQIVITKEQRK